MAVEYDVPQYFVTFTGPSPLSLSPPLLSLPPLSQRLFLAPSSLSPPPLSHRPRRRPLSLAATASVSFCILLLYTTACGS